MKLLIIFYYLISFDFVVLFDFVNDCFLTYGILLFLFARFILSDLSFLANVFGHYFVEHE